MPPTSPRSLPLKPGFAVWYRRIFLWGFAALVFAVSVWAFRAGVDASTPMITFLNLVPGIVMLCVAWAVTAVLLTLAWLGLRRAMH